MKLIKSLLILLPMLVLMTCDSADGLVGINDKFWNEEEEASGGGGPSGFSPASISNLMLWLDANDASTLITTGTDVDQWNDKSGNGNNFSQTLNTNYRPDVNSGGLNGKNTITFTQGSSNKLKLSSGTLECLVSTIFIVYKAVGANEYFYFLGNDSSYTTYRVYTASAANRLYLTYSATTSELITVSNINQNNVSHMFMLKLRDNGNKFVVSLDGDIESNSTNNLNKTTYPLDVLGAYRNSETAANNLFNGDMAEVVIYNSILSTSEKQKIEGYLAHKWGLTSNLPPDHPYKTSAP